MTLQEYKNFYIGFIVTILVPSVKREANSDYGLGQDLATQACYENNKNGLIVLSLVSILETNFLTIKKEFKALRNFSGTLVALPSRINPVHLSSFIYLRDAFAHNPYGFLLPPGDNTSGFLNAVTAGDFLWSRVDGQAINIDAHALHELHLVVLRFFGENV